MAKISLVEGQSYFNPYNSKEFKVLSLDKPNNRMIFQYEGSETSEGDYESKRALVQKTIDDKMEGYERNLPFGEWFVAMQAADGDAENVFEKIHEQFSQPIPDEWIASKNLWFYEIIGNSTKGKIARKLYLGMMESLGHIVSKDDTGDYATSRDNHGIVNGRKKIVKVACIKGEGTTFWNNFRQKQDWDDVVFVCVLPNSLAIYEVSKENFISYIKTHINDVMWVGGVAAKEAVDSDIEKNDYFHWNQKEQFTDVFIKIY